MSARTAICFLSAALLATAGAWGQEAAQPGETRVVRAYFDDPLVAAKAVISLEALESEYEKGYIVLLATDEDIDVARQAGMRVVEDRDYVSVALPSELPTKVTQGTIAGFPCYRTVEETYAGAQAIVDAHPTLATWTTVGKSWKKVQNAAEGYDLMVLRLTNSATSGTKPALFITAAVHAREYTTAELALRFAEQLADAYETDADARWLLDHQEVHIMLHANPDGRKRAEEGVLWRKNHNTNHCPDTSPGIDLNRNFDFKWGEPGSSANECSFNYRGLSAASEPETQAIQTYMTNLFSDARGPDDDDAAPADTSGVFLDIHSHSRLILWPWGHVDVATPNGTELQTLGRKLAFFNGYTPMRSYGLYPTSGTTDDYSYGELGRASFTYELGTSFFQACSYFENSILDVNLESLLYAFKVARAPYLIPAGPDVRAPSLSGGASTSGVTAGTSITLSATFDDTRYQNSNGAEPTQDIAAGEYYLDIPPWVTGAVAHAMSAADGAFDSNSEEATATIATNGLSAGRHTVFVRAKDADNNWGAVSAVFAIVQMEPPPPPPDEDPEVEVSFGSASYEVPEGGTVEVTVRLSADPQREVSIPLVRTHRGGASEADYSGVPASITFSSGVTTRTFEFVAADDSEEDFGESVVLGFGVLPAGVSGGGSATVSIQDDDTPPMAVIEVSGVECDRELCRALTGEPVQFEDASTGSAASRRWDFGEGSESELRRWSHSWSEPGFHEVTLWVSDGPRESTSSRVFLVESSSPAGTCESSAERRCLQDSRYAVAVEWRKPDGESGPGSVVHAGTNDSGLFTFFNGENWEILIKVLDGCALNGHVWVYGASTTDLGYVIQVTDTVTGTVKEYRNEPGLPAPAITDAKAFPESCEGARAAP